MQSDLYTLKEGVISKNPLRESDADPVIELEGMKLKKVLISKNWRSCAHPTDYTCNIYLNYEYGRSRLLIEIVLRICWVWAGSLGISVSV